MNIMKNKINDSIFFILLTVMVLGLSLISYADTILAEAQQKTLEQLQELTVLTVTHNLDVTTPQNGQITIGWESDKPLTITDIDAGEFNTWLSFPLLPFTIDPILFDTVSITPPAFAVRSEGIIPYVLMPPPDFCNENQGLTINCTERIFYSIPLRIEMEFDGEQYLYNTQIIADFSIREPTFLSDQNLLIGTMIIMVTIGSGIFLKKRNQH